MSNTLQSGDILIVNRGLYKHYGIYAGNGTVIHYASRHGDFGDDICIHEAPLEQFANEDEIIVGRFSETFLRTHTLHSPEETVRRARSRIGERKYNLVTNNCEHFALWCKAGLSESFQVNVAAGALALFSMAVRSFIGDEESDSEPSLTDVPETKTKELNRLNTAPVEKVDILTAETVIGFFKTDSIKQKLIHNPNLTAIVLKYKQQIALCLYEQNTQTMEGIFKIYEPRCLDSDLQALFGDKDMIVLQ